MGNLALRVTIARQNKGRVVCELRHGLSYNVMRRAASSASRAFNDSRERGSFRPARTESEGESLIFVVEEREIVLVFFDGAAVFESTTGFPFHDDACQDGDCKADKHKKAYALEGFEEEMVKRCEVHEVSFHEGAPHKGAHGDERIGGKNDESFENGYLSAFYRACETLTSENLFL